MGSLCKALCWLGVLSVWHVQVCLLGSVVLPNMCILALLRTTVEPCSMQGLQPTPKPPRLAVYTLQQKHTSSFVHARLTHHRYAGVLSAVGIHLADIVQEAQEPTATELSPDTLPELSQRLDTLAAAAVGKLRAQGFDDKHIGVEHFLNLRCGHGCGFAHPPSVGVVRITNFGEYLQSAAQANHHADCLVGVGMGEECSPSFVLSACRQALQASPLW